MRLENIPSKLTVYLMLMATALLVLLNIDEMWGRSVDLAHHYVLAFRLAEQFHLTSAYDPTLGEMSYYPRLSHLLSAIVGMLVGSTLLGIQLTALVSLFIIWFCYVYLVGSLPRALAIASIVFLTVLTFLNKRVLHLEIHGNEIIDNYFFSQLVAQSLAILVIVLAFISERRAGRWAAYFVLVAGVFIDTGVHLLPTLELLATLSFLLLLDAIVVRRSNVKWQFWLLPLVLVPLCALAGVLVNPAFSAMREIADNNGDLWFRRISYPVGLIGICVSVLLLSASMAWAYLRKNGAYAWPVLKYLSAIGLGMSTLCLLQITLVQWGYGSDYAVKKYSYGLLTLLLIDVSVGLGALAVRGLRLHNHPAPWANGPLVAVVTAGLFFCIASNSTPRGNRFDLSELVQTEQSMIGLLAGGYMPARPPRHDVVMGASPISTFDYMFALAITRTPREEAIPEVLLAHELPDLRKYDNIVTTPGTRRYDSPQCRRNSNRLLVVNSADCLAMLAREPEKCHGSFDFTKNGALPVGSFEGFSVPEDHGRWMHTKMARFTCTESSIAAKGMTIRVAPFFSGEHQQQRLAIKVNDMKVYEGVFVGGRPVEPIHVALPSSDKRGYVIEFDTPDAVAPKALGLGEDNRQLSFSLQDLTFE
jgi:hypothetical protein